MEQSSDGVLMELEHICENFLDNADLHINLTNYPSVELRYLVYGTVENKYWEVIFNCGQVISLHIENDSDTQNNELHLVLEASVMLIAPDELSLDIKDRLPIASKVWRVWSYGDGQLEIFTSKFDWELNQLTEEEYKHRYN